jgi:hypothetical protein
MRGALWAIGALMVVGGFGFAALTVAGAAMSDSPSGSAAAVDDAKLYAGIGVAGLVAIGAGFWF